MLFKPVSKTARKGLFVGQSIGLVNVENNQRDKSVLSDQVNTFNQQYIRQLKAIKSKYRSTPVSARNCQKSKHAD
jgi:hypothetical protein